MSTTTEQLATMLTEACNTHDIERVAALYAPSYEGIDVGHAMPHHGPDEVRQVLKRYLQAFPDLQFRLEEMLTESQHIVLVWTAEGTHRGPLMNIPATGRKVQVRSVSVLTVRDQQIVHGLYIWDVAGLLRHIGLLPELA